MLRFLSTLALAALGHADSLTIQCGRVLDVAAGVYSKSTTISIDADRFVSSADGKTIDLSNLTCLPGLIEAHAHLTNDPRNSGYKRLGVSYTRAALIGAKNAKTLLYAGFTTVRNVGAAGYADVALREAIDAGDVEGPRLLVSGPSLSITGGHCDSNLLAPEFHHFSQGVADGPWAGRAKVRENVKYGADLIKVCASGGVLSKGDQPGTPQYSLEELKAIVEEAHKLGRKVASHAHGAQSIKDSILAGVDSVEHCSFIDDEGIALAKKQGTFLVFDIYNDDYILAEGLKVGMLPESIEKEKFVGKTQRENFLKAWKAGVRMAFGTDSGVYPHGENWKQFPYMVEFGMKPAEAIRAATLDAAELLGLQGKAGTITPGAFADLIAVEGDPLQDVRALQQVRFVMKAGQVVKRP